MLAGLVAAAALTAMEPAIENDLRCIGIFALAASRHEEMSQSEQAGVTGALMYYVGRIEGRRPDFRLEDSLADLLRSPAYLEGLADDARRCGAEMKAKGQQLSDLGKAMKQTGKESPAEGD
ncbi:hypothetical protein [Novosphingobium mangrovi (ex Huang et al. 2023)]|uniref:Rap1a immunity protein domain-containing protein n=1 Tax=Novosphingobium mangrovi (ex Huang et al. 2023) TaxID=2976432 RepID=A0ABT2I906_9SPHN|nr:hypothetical protein [Novosphingobium mangrovi (ex Huang et al. 2023)]MCT2401304.1 hypothetical protein [Novosphingobium mangrovi (ex Huang et al. 2023)]